MLNHDSLLGTLCVHLRDPARIQFREPNLNGWAMGGHYGSPDLLEVTKSYARFVRRIYEVKATPSDLQVDLRAEKWTRYLPACDRLTFAVQDGVDFEKHLRPLPVGVMVYKNGRWRTVRAAPVNLKAEAWPENVWMALLFGRLGHRSDTRLERLEKERVVLLSRDLDELRHQAAGHLSKIAQELNLRQKGLDRRALDLDERDRDLEHEHLQRAMRKLGQLLQVHAWGVTSVDDLYRRWAQQTLQTAAEAARARLLEELAPNPGSERGKTS